MGPAGYLPAGPHYLGLYQPRLSQPCFVLATGAVPTKVVWLFA
jgi:hypothetical protein